MFGVDRNDRRVMLGGKPHHVIAAHHKRLLVCQSDLLAGFNCGDGRQQPRISDQCIDHDIDRRGRYDLSDRFGSGIDLDRFVGEDPHERIA